MLPKAGFAENYHQISGNFPVLIASTFLNARFPTCLYQMEFFSSLAAFSQLPEFTASIVFLNRENLDGLRLKAKSTRITCLTVSIASKFGKSFLKIFGKNHFETYVINGGITWHKSESIDLYHVLL